MEDLFYSAGWQEFWDDDLQDIDVDDENAVNDDLDFNAKDVNRQQAWGVVKSHMNAAEAKSSNPSPRVMSRAFFARCAILNSRRMRLPMISSAASSPTLSSKIMLN